MYFTTTPQNIPPSTHATLLDHQIQLFFYFYWHITLKHSAYKPNRTKREQSLQLQMLPSAKEFPHIKFQVIFTLYSISISLNTGATASCQPGKTIMARSV